MSKIESITKTPDYVRYIPLSPDTFVEPEFITELLTFAEIEKLLHVEQDSDGRKYLPFSPELVSIALESETDEIYGQRKNIYANLTDHWNNFVEADLVVPDKYKRANMHAQRVGYEVIRTYLAYQLLHELQMDNPYATLDKYTFEEREFTPQQYQKAIKAGLAGLLHDIGKGHVLDINEWGYKNFEQWDTLKSTEKYTEEQRERMIHHRAEGAKMLQESGLPYYYAQVALNHHNENESFVKDAHEAFEVTLDSEQLISVVVKIRDQFDAATKDRPYSQAQPLAEMHSDERIIRQLDIFGDQLLTVVYHENIDILREELEEMIPIVLEPVDLRELELV